MKKKIFLQNNTWPEKVSSAVYRTAAVMLASGIPAILRAGTQPVAEILVIAGVGGIAALIRYYLYDMQMEKEYEAYYENFSHVMKNTDIRSKKCSVNNTGNRKIQKEQRRKKKAS